MIESLVRLRVLLDQNYDCLVFQSKRTRSTKAVQIVETNSRLPWFFVYYFVEFLNNFETMNALVVTQETLIGQNIESILNSVLLFLPGYNML